MDRESAKQEGERNRTYCTWKAFYIYSWKNTKLCTNLLLDGAWWQSRRNANISSVSAIEKIVQTEMRNEKN